MAIGIYKITSPVGGIYIGQSTDVYRRIRQHKGTGDVKSKHRLLKQSFDAYGIENHIFEILEECSINKLDELEIHYISIFNSCLGEHGLNCQTGGKIGYNWNPKFLKEFSDFGKLCQFTQEHRDRLRIANTGKVRTKETHEKLMVHFYKNEVALRRGSFEHNAKKVIDTTTGEIYDSVKNAAKSFNLPESTLNQYLSGSRKNKTTLTYYSRLQ